MEAHRQQDNEHKDQKLFLRNAVNGQQTNCHGQRLSDSRQMKAKQTERQITQKGDIKTAGVAIKKPAVAKGNHSRSNRQKKSRIGPNGMEQLAQKL